MMWSMKFSLRVMLGIMIVRDGLKKRANKPRTLFLGDLQMSDHLGHDKNTALPGVLGISCNSHPSATTNLR